MINTEKITISNVRNYIAGIDKEVTLLDGSNKQYIFFDNAASTPSFTPVRDIVNESLEWYSAVHRGAGIKSLISTKAYDDAHDIIGKFVNADLSNNTVIFVKNTTEAINKLSHRLNLTKKDIVLVSGMEHHSNDLPYRRFCKVVFIKINSDGTLNIEDIRRKAKKYEGKLKLIAVTGAANVTGFINPIHEIAEIAHRQKALIMVDAAQLAPHRKINMMPDDHPQHIDFLAMSSHKMYAPYGTGVLIGSKKIFEKGDPDMVGGGTVSIVTHEEVHWNHLPDREEAGTPNLPGAIAFAKACQILDEIGMDNLASHEIELTHYILKKIKKIPEIKLLGKTKLNDLQNKLGVITFNIEGYHDGLAAAILCYEGGIGLRNGCFCAHPYIKQLLKVSKEDSDKLIKNILSGNRTELPGALRASFGCYNTIEEIDAFLEMTEKIIRKEYKGKYAQNPRTGNFSPENFKLNYSDYFSL